MRVLGLDLSTHTGWAVLDSEGGLLAYGTEDFIADDVPENIVADYRAIRFAEQAGSFVIGLVEKYNPNVIEIEQVNGSKFRSSQRVLEFVHCLVLIALRPFQEKVHYVDTSAWRSLLGIKLTPEQRKHNKAISSRKCALKKEGKQLHSKKGDGKITWKHLSVEWANKTFSLDLQLKDNDAADALALAKYALTDRKELQEPVDLDKTIAGWQSKS